MKNLNRVKELYLQATLRKFGLLLLATVVALALMTLLVTFLEIFSAWQITCIIVAISVGYFVFAVFLLINDTYYDIAESLGIHTESSENADSE